MVEKKIKGRKRHIATDTQGHLLHISVHAANLHDSTMGGKIFELALAKYPNLEGGCFDAGYRGTTVRHLETKLMKKAVISEKISDKWAVIPMRWVVERTFAWLNATRRLAKDFEISVVSEQAFIMISHAMLLLKRISIS